MKKDFEQLFTHLEPIEPPRGLFDKIIMAIKQEQELKHTKRLVFSFFALLLISLVSAPFSWSFAVQQVQNSGVGSFLSLIVSHFGNIAGLWQDSLLAIAESLPIFGLAVFGLNIILLLFSIRLFLRKKAILLRYLTHNINIKTA